MWVETIADSYGNGSAETICCLYETGMLKLQVPRRIVGQVENDPVEMGGVAQRQ